MKKVTTILAAILLMAVGAAAQKLSYQAVVRNSSNELVPNTALTVEVSVLDAVGTVQYAETHSATTNENGLLVLTIGDGTVTAGTTVADVDWNGAAIQSVVKNGSAVVATITSPVNAVPYALQAGSSAGSLSQVNADWEATSGVAEILHKPTIPTVNDGTLTITLPDGTSETFTANQGGNTNVSIPAMSVADLIALVGGMTDAEKEQLRDALGVTGDGGSGGSDPTTFNCGVDKMIIGEGANRQEYETVLIGTQCWTKTNLRATKKADGSDIANGGSNYSYTKPYYYDYSSSGIPLEERGYLYNWAAANVVCPAGWHLPSDAEWNTMEAAVSGSDWQTSYETSTGYRGSHAGKLAGGDNWSSSSTSGAPSDYGNADRNVSGFSAVPAGYCHNSSFNYAGRYAFFWSATQLNSTYAYYRYLCYNNAGVYREEGSRNYGRSVRCLRD